MPCSRSHRSGGIASTSSSRAAARGSVPRTSRFSSSDSVIVRRLSSSSISSASKNAVSLSRRQLGVVVEDDRRARAPPASCPAGPAEHREDALVAAACDEALRPLGRVEQRDERAALDLQQQVAATSARRSHAGRSGPDGRPRRSGSRRAGSPATTAYGESGRSTCVTDPQPQRLPVRTSRPTDDRARRQPRSRPRRHLDGHGRGSCPSGDVERRARARAPRPTARTSRHRRRAAGPS